MSTTLRMALAPRFKNAAFGIHLKRILGQEIWGHDGSIPSDWTEVNDGLVPFLDGVIAGTDDPYLKEDATRLRDFLATEGVVLLRLET